MNNDNTQKVTIVMLTKNRPLFLDRILTYYAVSHFQCCIFISDANDGEN